MLTSADNERIMEVRVTDDELVVAFVDGRTLSVPLVWYPRLLHASPEQRSEWRLIGDGDGVHWPQIDEDLSAAGLLRGVSAPAHRELSQPEGSGETFALDNILENYRGKEQTQTSEQAQKVNIPEWAQGLYHSHGIMSEVLVYHDDEAIYFEHKGNESGIVRFTFEMIEGLKIVEEEKESTESPQ